MVRGLWGFEERVLRVTGVVFTLLPRTPAPAVSPADQGTSQMPRLGNVGMMHGIGVINGAGVSPGASGVAARSDKATTWRHHPG